MRKKRQDKTQTQTQTQEGLISPRQILERIVVGERAIALMTELSQFAENAREQLNRMHDSARAMVPKAQQEARQEARKSRTTKRTCKETGCKELSKGPRFGNLCAEHAAASGYTAAGPRAKSKTQTKRRSKTKARRHHVNGHGQAHATA